MAGCNFKACRRVVLTGKRWRGTASGPALTPLGYEHSNLLGHYAFSVA